MIDHVTFGVSDFSKAIGFYDLALAPLGVARLVNIPVGADSSVAVAAYGDTRPWFWLAAENPTNGKLHVALSASSRDQVDQFYASAIAAGGRDNGAPGVRAHYHPDYYGAFVLDPDGHNIEAVCHTA